MGMGGFPVGGEASYGDGFGEPRSTHIHQGVDITAAGGTPVRAPEEGVVRFSEDGGYGKVATVTITDGTYYFMAHLDGFADGVETGSAVKQGTTIGYVGATGNATGTHVHFELRPGGGGAADPKPLLDRWLDDALAALPGILASFIAVDTSLPRALTAVGVLRRFDPGPSGVPGGRSALVSTAAGHRLAAGPADWRQATQLARAVLSPVTPPPLKAVLAPEGY